MTDNGWDDQIPKTKKKSLKKKFEFKEDTNLGKIIITIFGRKGEGKTTTAMMFPGKISVLSFDNKSLHVKINSYENTDRIKVYDAVEYYDQDPDYVTEAAIETYEYIKFLLTNIAEKDKPHWILIDGLEILTKIAEMVMRNNHGLKPFQGVSNRNIWKERRFIIDQIHNTAAKIAKKGVIYTVYTAKDEIVEEGTIITKKDVPKWFDSVMYETDITLQVQSVYDKVEGSKHTVTVSNSKFDQMFKTGEVIDTTDKPFTDRIKDFYKNQKK